MCQILYPLKFDYIYYSFLFYCRFVSGINNIRFRVVLETMWKKVAVVLISALTWRVKG